MSRETVVKQRERPVRAVSERNSGVGESLKPLPIPLPGNHALYRDRFNLIVQHPMTCSQGLNTGLRRHGSRAFSFKQTYFSQGHWVVWELETNCGVKLSAATRAAILPLKRGVA